MLLCVAGCSKSDNFSLMPGQTAHIVTNFRRVEVRAEYPVSIRQGQCFVPRTLDSPMNCATDLLITDLRPAILVWAHGNNVTVTARYF